MEDVAGTRTSYHSSGALSLPAAAHRCDAWRWLVVASSAKQKAAATPPAAKQQQHHLKTFKFPENLDLFNLIYSIYLISFSKNILHRNTKDIAYCRAKGWCFVYHCKNDSLLTAVKGC
jgi:hypothetical protein